MLNHFKQLDRLLRGEATSDSALRFGSLLISIDKIALASLLLAAVYGLCMGVFSLANGNDMLFQRMAATILKVPALFFLTLLVTFPSLYIFNTLVGSRLKMGEVLRLLLASLGVMVAVLASFGPIVAFFSVSTSNYAFMLLLNVAVYAVAGILGLRFMLRTLERITRAEAKEREEERKEELTNNKAEAGGREVSAAEETDWNIPGREEFSIAELEGALASGQSRTGALDKEPERKVDPRVGTIFRIWIVVFALVGGQMGWVLRPFLGDPNLPFTWLRERDSSFFEAVGKAFLQMLRG